MNKEDIINLSEKLLTRMIAQGEDFDDFIYSYFEENPGHLEGEFEELSPQELLNSPKIKEHLVHTMKILIDSIKTMREH